MNIVDHDFPADRAYPFGIVTDEDGTEYIVTHKLERMVIMDSRPPELHFDTMEVLNRCDKCHRADFRPMVAHGWEDAFIRGLIVRKPDPR